MSAHANRNPIKAVISRTPTKAITVRLRAYPNERAAWKRIARAERVTLSAWIRDVLNAQLDEPPQPAKRKRNT